MKIASKNFIILLNMMGSTIIISSSSWFSIWVGMEITSMTMPAIISSVSSSLVSKINSWKYYMIQCYSSCIFFISILCLSMSSMNSLNSNLCWMIIILSMVMKMGLIPFHGWLFQISSSMSWASFLVLSTIQKIGPLVVISESSKALSSSFSVDLMLGIIMSLVSVMGMMIYSIRFFMVVSSLINSAWMISSAQIGKMCLFMYMFFYFIHLIMLFCYFNSEFSISLESLLFSSKKEFSIETLKILTILSLIGLPPTLGFFMKLSVLEHLMLTNQVFSMIILIFSSSLVMIMYMKMIMKMINNMRVEKVQQFKFNLSVPFMTILTFFSSVFILV